MEQTLNVELEPKQLTAYRYLIDDVTEELFYGGAAGGGKSVLGCIWIILGCIRYQGSRWLIGRAVLKSLKESTLLTFWDMCKLFGLKSGTHYSYKEQAGIIKFINGSEVYLKDLCQYPHDPDFDSLGSTEYTGAFIDEGSQVSEKAYNIVKSRLRYKTKEFGILAKILTASNPCKNFLYAVFYKAWKNGKLKPHMKFVQAFVQDNKHLSEDYIRKLENLDEVSKQRLLYGNWEYDSDPSKIFEYDKIIDMFTNEYVLEPDADKYISCDVARFGRDKTVIMVWQGLYVKQIYHYQGQDTKTTAKEIERICLEQGIPRSRVIIDEDGIGGGTVDDIPGCQGFINNARQSDEGSLVNYKNIKTQCYFKLAELVNKGRIGINCEHPETRALIISDLEQIKRKNADKDTTVQLVDKEEIKKNIGRSPDFSDCLMMRMYYEVRGGDAILLNDEEGLVM